jgi:WD40 repeat protein
MEPAATIPEPLRYWAFVSYSHRDKAAADWLHRALETQPVPKPLVGRPTRLGVITPRLTPVFRDREELAASPDLGVRIEEALRQSRYLIVICSPQAAASPWVNKEIAFFKSLGREDRVFSLIVAGEPYASSMPGREAEECFPKALRHHVGPSGLEEDSLAEPLAADLRPEKDGQKGALLKLMAGMLEVSFDTLRQRERERRRAQLWRLAGASVLLVAILAGLIVYGVLQSKGRQEQAADAQTQRGLVTAQTAVTEERTAVAQSRQLAIQSASLLKTSPDLPLLLSLEALRTADTAEARQSLFKALTGDSASISYLRPAAKTTWDALAVSRDGQTLVSAGQDGGLTFWNLAADPPTPRRVEAHAGQVNALVLSGDGTTLASAGDDGLVRFWDMARRQPLEAQPVPKQEFKVNAVALGRDGLVALGSGDSAKIVLWDTAAGQPVAELDDPAGFSVSSLAFSPDGQTLASSGVGGDTILWDLASKQQRHAEFVKDTRSVSFSPDGQWLAAGSLQLIVRKTADFEPFELPLSDAPAYVTAAFSPDGRSVASASTKGNATVWDVDTRKIANGPWQLKIGSLDALAWSPDSSTLFASGEDGVIARVSLHSMPLRRGLAVDREVAGFGFLPGGKLLVAATGTDSGQSTLSLWDPASLKKIADSPAGADPLGPLGVTRDGKTLVTGNFQGKLLFWDVARRQAIGDPVPAFDDNRVDRVVFSPDGSTVAALSPGPEVRFWNVASRQRLPSTLRADPEYARDVVFTPDGAHVFTAGDKGEIIEWDWRSGQAVGAPIQVGKSVEALALSPDGRTLAAGEAGDHDSRVTLWSTETRAMAGTPLVGHKDIVRAVAFSPDGRFLASSGDDGFAILWDLGSRQGIARLDYGVKVTSGDGSAATPRSINHVAFSPDGTALVTDGPEQGLLVWEIDVKAWQRRAYRIANRSLTPEEWRRYIGGSTPYRQTCPPAPTR